MSKIVNITLGTSSLSLHGSNVILSLKVCTAVMSVGN